MSKDGLRKQCSVLDWMLPKNNLEVEIRTKAHDTLFTGKEAVMSPWKKNMIIVVVEECPSLCFL